MWWETSSKKTSASKYRNVDKACVWASDEQEHGDYPSTALHGYWRRTIFWLRFDDIRAMAKIVLKTLYFIHWPSLTTRILAEPEFVGQIQRWMVKITIFTFTMIFSWLCVPNVCRRLSPQPANIMFFNKIIALCCATLAPLAKRAKVANKEIGKFSGKLFC